MILYRDENITISLNDTPFLQKTCSLVFRQYLTKNAVTVVIDSLLTSLIRYSLNKEPC
jgi:hypothetical protein